MPIKYKEVRDNGNIVVEQIATRPTVYLDNWTMNLFSFDNIELGKRFLSCMEAVHGTIAFSLINLIEITNRTDKNQVHKIIKYLEHFDGVLIDSNPWSVIQKENNFAFPNLVSPCADLIMLENLALHSQNPLSILNFSETISLFEKYMELFLRKINDDFESGLFQLVEKARNDDRRLKIAKQHVKRKINKKESPFSYVREMAWFAYEYIISLENMKMGNSEWRDLFNIIVPVSYCDFVLCDGRWASFIGTTGLNYPNIAQVYTKRTIEKFLLELQRYDSTAEKKC